MSEISREEVKQLLDDMVELGFIRVIIDDNGVERYELTELGRLEMAFHVE